MSDIDPVLTITEKTRGMAKHAGFFTFYWDDKEGKVWLEVENLDTPFLYVDSLTQGVGSNDIGLDRNQLGATRIVEFRRVGPKLLLVEPNQWYRATSSNPWEVSAVDEAFAESIHWGFTVEAEESGRVLVDVTEFLLRDAKNVAAIMTAKEQGEYTLDEQRSVIYLPRSKSFPRNTEFEAVLTFTGKEPGDWIKSVAPDPLNVSVRTHFSFIELPDDEYKPRRYDLRASYFGVKYMDYATPVHMNIEKRFICRHRLRKLTPESETSDPVEPIVYYVDRGIPEPIRSAIVEGARWWNLAYEAAGYRDAFRVELLPEDADPMDIRYNMINWIHRKTRGWSYGNTVTDPRTGEIIKGHVSMCSLRIRQDFLIAQGLVADYDLDDPDSTEMMEMSLARIRQLSVHEVGHTLGLGHNYCSHVNGRASVMDYPAPLVQITDGHLDLSDAYDTGVGAWDKVSIAYGYQDFPEEVIEDEALNKILRDAFNAGLIFAPSQDAGTGSAHPYAASWVNGADPVDELTHMMTVRQVALDRFSERLLMKGEPLARLEEVLVPLYLIHRYQLESACSLLGGLYYNHTIRGDVQEDPHIVPGDEQRRALEALLDTVEPERLTLGEHILNLIPPRPQGYNQTPDLFPGYTGVTFDALTAAETAANLSFTVLLHRQRAQRLIEYSSRDPSTPSLGEVLDRVIESTWLKNRSNGVEGEVQRVVDNVALYYMVELAQSTEVSTAVRSVAQEKLHELREAVEPRLEDASDRELAHLLYAVNTVNLLEQSPTELALTKPVDPPMGPPI